jgi:hypothetical protein
MKTGALAGASVAGSEPELELPPPQPAMASAAEAATTGRAKRTFTERAS